jgi:dTMP kinase
VAIGRFITLEGGEGVGKSTLIQGIHEWLAAKQIQVVQSREPGGTLIADEIRRIFKSPPAGDDMTSDTETLLVSAARCQHVSKVIAPAIKSGAWVLCDRYADSTRVYQGLFGGVPLHDLEWIIKFSTGGLEPDLTFLLDCDVSITMNRIGSRVESEKDDDAARFDHAGIAVHERLRQGYRRIAGFFPARFYILDASRPADQVLHDACAEMERRWNL